MVCIRQGPRMLLNVLQAEEESRIIWSRKSILPGLRNLGPDQGWGIVLCQEPFGHLQQHLRSTQKDQLKNQPAMIGLLNSEFCPWLSMVGSEGMIPGASYSL